MAVLTHTIGGVGPVETTLGGHTQRLEPRVQPTRMWDGELRSQITEYRGFSKVWSFRTPEMRYDEALALESQLLNAGTRLVSGPLVGVNVPCHVRNVEIDYFDNPYNRFVSYELKETVNVGGDRCEYLRLEIENLAGNWVDMTRWFVRGNGRRDLEQFADTCDLTVLREDHTGSLNPLVNQNLPVDVDRRVRLRFASVPDGETLTDDDWWWLFVGKTYNLELGGKEPYMPVRCRDNAGRIIDTLITEIEMYGNEAGTARVENVMQEVLDRWLTDPTIELTTLGDPDQGVNLYNLQLKHLHEALFELRDLNGWDLHHFTQNGGANDGQSDLTFYEPDRDKTEPDLILSEPDYYSITALRKTLELVKNRAVIKWRETEEGTEVVTVDAEESDSADIRAMYFDESGNPLINTAAAAAAWGTLVLQDTAFAPLSHQSTMPIRRIDIGDMIRYAADNVHYGTDQDVATIAYGWDISHDGGVMTVDGAIAPRGSVTRWHNRSRYSGIKTRIDPNPAPELTEQSVEFYYTTAEGSKGFTQESTADESLGGWISKTPAEPTLMGLFREVTEVERQAGITLYRSLGIVNLSEVFNVYRPLAFLGALGEDGITWSIAVDPEGAVPLERTTIQSAVSPDEESPPDGVLLAYVSPDSTTHEDVIALSFLLEPRQAIVVHIKLEVVDAGFPGQITDSSLVMQSFIPSE